MYPLPTVLVLQKPWRAQPAGRDLPTQSQVGSTDSVSHPLEGAGWILEVEGGQSIHPFLLLLPASLALILSLCAHSFHETGSGGGRRREEGRWRVLVPQPGSWVGCGVLGNCRNHAEPGCSHVHQHVFALVERGGEYWISLWSRLNL